MIISRILHLIEITGTSQKELMNATGLSASAIAEWEQGKTAPSADAIVKISSYFSVPIEYILGLGIFENWSEIVQHKDAVWGGLGNSPYNGAYFATEDGKSLRAVFYDAMYLETDDLSMIRLFAWAVKSIFFFIRTDVDDDNTEFVEARIEFSDIIPLLLEEKSSAAPSRMTAEDIANNFMDRMLNAPRYALNPDELRLLKMYRRLSNMEKGEVFRAVDNILKRNWRTDRPDAEY